MSSAVSLFRQLFDKQSVRVACLNLYLIAANVLLALFLLNPHFYRHSNVYKTNKRYCFRKSFLNWSLNCSLFTTVKSQFKDNFQKKKRKKKSSSPFLANYQPTLAITI
jgi:hypothetical protein